MNRRDLLKRATTTATILATSSLVTTLTTVAQSVFTGIDLGLPEGYDEVWGADINDVGDVVLNARKDDVWHAFVLRGGEFQELGDRGAENYAQAINTEGLITGWSRGGELAPVDDLQRAALLGQEVTIGLLWTGFESGGFQTDSRGFSIGQAIFEENGPAMAAIWTPETVTALDGLVLGLPSCAVDVNIDGQIGGWGVIDAAGTEHAAVWTETVPADLGTIGGNWSRLLAITDGGLAVGISTTDAQQIGLDADGATAFTWIDGAMTALPALEGSVWSRANDINSYGLAVGSARIGGSAASPVPAGNAGTIAVVWGVSTALDVNQITQQSDAFIYTEAVAVNSAGQILCNAINVDGKGRIALLSTMGT